MSSRRILKIAVRQSPLAIRQAEIIIDALKHAGNDIECELIPIVSSGDKLLNQPLAEIGGKGLFVKELETALLEQKADIAVHSAKDMPVDHAKGLMLGAVFKRGDPRDVLVSKNYANLAALPKKAIVGTSSLRRAAIIKALRSDLIIKTIRGNVGTRIKKLMAEEYDALIIAAAGIARLDLEVPHLTYLSLDQSLPSIGQGTIAIECRASDENVRDLLLTDINHYPSQQCLLAERAMNKTLGGNCHAPISGYAEIVGKSLFLRGWVLSKTDATIIKAECRGKVDQAEMIGRIVAEMLLAQGAARLLQ